MARERSRPRTYCPACDEPIDAAIAQSEAPQCPVCGQALTPVRVAGAWRRAAASLVDFALLGLTAGLLNWAVLAWMDVPPLTGRATGLNIVLRLLELEVTDVLVRYAPLLGMSALYFGLFWALTGQTPGAKLLRIRVVDLHGRPPRPLWAILRVVTHFLSGLPAGLGWLWSAFDLEKRAWHDHIARTYVVRVP